MALSDVVRQLRELADELESNYEEAPVNNENEETENTEQVIKALSTPNFFGTFGKNSHDLSGEATARVESGSALQVGENQRFNCTPTLMDGSKGKGDDPRINGNPKFYKQDDTNNGKSPIVEYAWGSGDKEFSNSGDDPFHLNSYEDNAGFTPNLKLQRQVGPGSNKCWIEAFVRAKYNGGVEVRSGRREFRAD